jgi:hypothetical protein
MYLLCNQWSIWDVIAFIRLHAFASSREPHFVSVRLSASWKPRRRFSPSATIAARNSDGPDSMLNRITPICSGSGNLMARQRCDRTKLSV